MSLTPAELNAALDKSCSMTSQKGGVAKTTTTAQYAKFLANIGMRVLIVDADTNRSMTVLTGTGPTVENPVSIADLIKYPTEPSIISRAAHLATEPWQPDTTRPWKLGGALVPGGSVHVVPSPGAALQEIADEKPAAAHLRLWKGLHESGLSADYDVVLIDCPPSVGSTTELAILASGWAIFPAHPELLGTVGFADGVRAVQHFAEAWRHPLAVAGVVVTKVNRTTEHRVGIEGTVQFVSGTWPDSGFDAEDPRDAFASGVWAPVINEAAFVAAANGRGESVADALPSMFTAAGEPKINTESQLRLVSAYMRHALNLLALLAPERYEETIEKLEKEQLPDVMREVLFESPLKFTVEADDEDDHVPAADAGGDEGAAVAVAVAEGVQ